MSEIHQVIDWLSCKLYNVFTSNNLFRLLWCLCFKWAISLKMCAPRAFLISLFVFINQVFKYFTITIIHYPKTVFFNSRTVCSKDLHGFDSSLEQNTQNTTWNFETHGNCDRSRRQIGWERCFHWRVVANHTEKALTKSFSFHIDFKRNHPDAHGTWETLRQPQQQKRIDHNHRLSPFICLRLLNQNNPLAFCTVFPLKSE